jgi:dolichol-phosphate mannosyltransferase
MVRTIRRHSRHAGGGQAPLRGGHQVGLIGHRVNRRDDWVKRLSSRLANGFRDLLLRDGIPDTGCGLKVVRRDWYLRLPGFNHMHRYIPALIQAQGPHVPLAGQPQAAAGGRSKYGVWNRLWVGLVDVVGVWWLQRRSKVVEIREMLE